jgi:hypothetical protein
VCFTLGVGGVAVQLVLADIAERLETRLETRGINRPERWLAGVEGDLDRALAETVTLTVDDVLLTSLLERLDTVPLVEPAADPRT